MKLTTYAEFLNESNKTQAVNEANNYVYIKHPEFTSVKDITSHITAKAGKAWSDFIAKHLGIKVNAKATIGRRDYVSLESAPLPTKDYGVFQYGMKSVSIDTFSGGEINWQNVGNQEDSFEFHGYIWFTIHYSYTHVAGGSNGCSLYLPGEDNHNVWYDIVNNQFLSSNEARAIGDKIWIKP